MPTGDDKKEYAARIFYGAVLLGSFTAAHLSGAIYVFIYLTAMLFLAMDEIGSFISDEMAKFLKNSPHYEKSSLKETEDKVLSSGDSRTRTGKKSESSDSEYIAEIYDRNDVQRVSNGLKIQFWFLVLLALFWYYCRALSMYSDKPIQVFRNLTMIAVPDINFTLSPNIISKIEFVIRNYAIFTILLYSFYIIHLIVFCTRHRSRHILVGEIVAAAGQHMAIFLILLPSNLSAVISLDFGVFWAFMNLTCVIFDDIAAYVIGKSIGKRLLTFLSPKKTVEGFVGAIIVTLIHAFTVTFLVTNLAPDSLQIPMFFQGPKYLHMLSNGQNSCQHSASDGHCHSSLTSSLLSSSQNSDEYSTISSAGFLFACPEFSSTFHPYACIYFHVFVIALFASFISPFGGLLASGIKRCVNRKDFGKSLGPHGGFIDRFDCKGIQSMLVYAYLSTVLNEQYYVN